MAENNNKELEEILVTEPETKIGLLDETELTPLEDKEALDGLSGLVKKVYPYALGLGVSILSESPGSVIQIVKALGIDINKGLKYLFEARANTCADALQIDMGYPKEIVDFQRGLDKNNPMIGTVFFMIFSVINLLLKIYGTTTLTKSRLLQDSNKDMPIQIPSTDVIFSALLKDTNFKDEAKDFLDRLGLDRNAQELYWDAIKQVPSIDILFQNLWRGKIDEAEVVKHLKRMGYGADEQTIITNITERIPPIQDIIHFSVREAFSEELSEKYGHNIEFPPEVAEWSEKQGFSGDWALKYWRSHWQLPSVQMVFEMLHRKIEKPDGTAFNKDDVYDLLRMADYPVFWRDLLTQISYRVITRVDARRMYKLGVFDNLPDMTAEQRVKEVYEQQGYNAVDAEYMKDFTIEFTADQRRSFTVAGLKKLRHYGILTEAEMRIKLTELRVHTDEIDLIIDEVDYEIEDKKFENCLEFQKDW